MKGKFGYSILKEYNLILIKIEDDYTLDDITIFKEKMALDKDFHMNLKSLYELRKSNYVGTFEQIDAFVDWVVANEDKFSTNNSSFLTATPKQIVISKMITDNEKLKKNIYGDHTTLKGALAFLGIPLSKLDIIYEELRKIILTEL